MVDRAGASGRSQLGRGDRRGVHRRTERLGSALRSATVIGSAGATGYTSIAGISGVGHSGAHNGPHLFNDHDTLSMIITVLPPHRADALIDAIRTLLTGHSGVMFITDTRVSRPEYFQ